MSYNDPNQPSSFPPPLPGSGPVPFPGDTLAAEPPRTGLATAAVVLGIIGLITGCVCIGGLVGVIALTLGLVAIGMARSDPTRYGGQGRAVAGIILGLLAVLITVAVFVFLTQGIRPVSKHIMAADALGQGLQNYYQAHGTYPPTLATLVESTQLVTPVANQPVSLPDDTHYYAGLDPNDPPHWILAYLPGRAFGVQVYVVVAPHARGTGDVELAAQFQARQQQFIREFQEKHGHPPAATTPSGPADDEVIVPAEAAPTTTAPAP